MTSHPVAMLLPVMLNSTFCSTTIVRKKRRNALQGMHRTYFRSREWCHFRWRHFLSYDVTSGEGHFRWHLLKCDFVCAYILLTEFELTTLEVIGTVCTGSCKSNLITTTTTPIQVCLYVCKWMRRNWLTPIRHIVPFVRLCGVPLYLSKGIYHMCT